MPSLMVSFAHSSKLDSSERLMVLGLRKQTVSRCLDTFHRFFPLRRRLIQAAAFGMFLYLFFYVSWPYSATFSSTIIPNKEWIPVEVFLWLDPLVGLTASVAARVLGFALLMSVSVLILSVAIPRWFCGYVCPLGTLIDCVDWMIGRHVRLLGQATDGWWKHLKYYLLTAILVSSALGMLLSGFAAAIPVVTRGMSFTLGTLQLGWMRNWSQVRPIGLSDWISILLFGAVLLGAVLSRRFWCRYVCPSGALFSLASLLRLTERKVTSACVDCGRCRDVCPFDAIHRDYSTRPLDCTWCQTCDGACPVGAIQFSSGRASTNDSRLLTVDIPDNHPSRRGFLTATVSAGCAALGLRQSSADASLLRPPGSLSETQFLQLCIRCGQCYQVCPGPVLHPAGFQHTFDALWTPIAVFAHAGCHQECNFCALICPTGAIRPLTIEQKRTTSMGLAVIDPQLCLAHTGDQDCRLCVDECDAAGYGAVRIQQIELTLEGIPEGMFSDEELDQMSHIDAPFIDAEACVGCGLCEYRCNAVFVKREKRLPSSAVYVVAETAERLVRE
jgi:ferredoxin